MNTQQELISLGFNFLEEVNPDHFKYRHRLGFLLIINEEKKLSYYIYSLDVHKALNRLYKVMAGDQKGTKTLLDEALRNSNPSDWVMYFRPNGLYPGLRQYLKDKLQEYKSLNVINIRADPARISWAYHVHHAISDRTIIVLSDTVLKDDSVIEQFLRSWRKSLEQSVNRKFIQPDLYYKGCGQVAVAVKQWMRSEVTNFEIIEIKKHSGKPRNTMREEVRIHNCSKSIAYRKEVLA